MWWSFSKSMSHDMLDVITQMAGANPVIRMFTGTIPANADAALPGDVTVFSELACSAALAPPADRKCLTFNTIQADSSATFPADPVDGPTFFRLYDASDNCILQGDVTEQGAGGIIQINYTALAPNTPVQIKKLVLMLG
jgi:hypothetical protein